ncbi:MAG: hypothetical protein JJD93_11005 [Ilumatobacteraceae bacterium]|nr:hypothetical protein [Ilumatobacteraceae bacterium]
MNASVPRVPVPAFRPLRIYALDPMRLEDTGDGFVTPRAVLNVEYEPLQPGPIGQRFQVIDFDGSRDRFYEPVDLDDPLVIMTQGLTPSETEPRFHQQMVYAVASSVWSACEAALGRRIGAHHGGLKIFPHAFYGENAYYDPERTALLFGYFQADDSDPGANLPGQFVFTCLSHDVVAHETTHAVVDRLRPRFNEATNPDVTAFHEAFADLVAIFRHFTLDQVLIDAINKNKADVTSADVISGLARQFGYATAQQRALRDASDDKPDPTRLARTVEPHARGAILVQAVFDAYRTTYLARVQDLLRLASGGTGILPEGRPHPDLVRRLAREASATAQLYFERCVQAFTYLPPLDVTFADFLRAIVTVDAVTSPSDDSFRTAIIEAFRRRGIYATEAGSLAEQAIALPIQSGLALTKGLVPRLVNRTTSALGEWHQRNAMQQAEEGRLSAALSRWADGHAEAIGLVPPVEGQSEIEPVGFHSTLRRQTNGQPWVDTVLQFVQHRRDLVTDDLGGVVPKAAVTVIADAVGNVRYMIGKTMSAGSPRLEALRETIGEFDREDTKAAYTSKKGPTRLRVNFARLHGGIDRRSDW